MSEDRLVRIENRLDDLTQGQAELRRDVAVLKTDVGGLKTDVGDLKRYMGVLHEEVLERIKALVFDPEPLRREFRTGMAALREEIFRRLDPIEAAIRQRRNN